MGYVGDGTRPKNGLSAYEIAVKNGFLGTEIEWLDSLQGQPGTTTRAGITDKPLETLLYGNTTYTYTDGLVSLITYPQGTIALSYTDGLVTTATYTVGTDIYTITYTYTDGQITSIAYT